MFTRWCTHQHEGFTEDGARATHGFGTIEDSLSVMVPGTSRGVQQVVHSRARRVHRGWRSCNPWVCTIEGSLSSSATIEQMAPQVSCPENGGTKCRSCTLPSWHDRVCYARGRFVKSCTGAWRFERCFKGGALVSMKSLPRMALVQPMGLARSTAVALRVPLFDTWRSE